MPGGPLSLWGRARNTLRRAPCNVVHAPGAHWRQLTEEQRELRDGVRRVLEAQCPPALARAVHERAGEPGDVVHLEREAAEGIAGIRAIPWVFGWTQIRLMLPGWLGVGTALSAVASRSGGVDVLRRMSRDWPFFDDLLGKSRPYVSNALALLRLPQRVKDEVHAEGRAISRELLMGVARCETPDEAETLWSRLKLDLMSVRRFRAERTGRGALEWRP